MGVGAERIFVNMTEDWMQVTREANGNQNVDLNSQFGTIVATHPQLQLNRNSISSPPPSLNFVVHPCPSFARFCESRISSRSEVYKFVAWGSRADCLGRSNLDLPIYSYFN